MGLLSLGVLAGSQKEDERRLGIHPMHIDGIHAELREHTFFEHGYGERFGVSDAELASRVGGIRTRDELIADCDVILQPKPVTSEVAGLREGQTLWGWPHLVQDAVTTQHSIDLGLTHIAFEAMNRWSPDGSFNQHIFYQNNEMAGYVSVMQATQLGAITGEYGRPLRACVIGFGATARGAVIALKALSVGEIVVLARQEVIDRSVPVDGITLVPLDSVTTGTYLAGFDIVVNCFLQDPLAPLVWVSDQDLASFAHGSLIIDVSCDTGMGFSWARPTSFADPMFMVGDNIHFYAVDHSPSLLWRSATWVISEALLPHLGTVLSGPDAWDADESIRRAIEIREGVVQNPAILKYQNRTAAHPHIMATA